MPITVFVTGIAVGYAAWMLTHAWYGLVVGALLGAGIGKAAADKFLPN